MTVWTSTLATDVDQSATCPSSCNGIPHRVRCEAAVTYQTWVWNVFWFTELRSAETLQGISEPSVLLAPPLALVWFTLSRAQVCFGAFGNEGLEQCYSLWLGSQMGLLFLPRGIWQCHLWLSQWGAGLASRRGGQDTSDSPTRHSIAMNHPSQSVCSDM